MQASKLSQVFKQTQEEGTTLVIQHYYEGTHFPTTIHAISVVTGYNEIGETVIVLGEDPARIVEYKPEEDIEAYKMKMISLD